MLMLLNSIVTPYPMLVEDAAGCTITRLDTVSVLLENFLAAVSTDDVVKLLLNYDVLETVQIGVHNTPLPGGALCLSIAVVVVAWGRSSSYQTREQGLLRNRLCVFGYKQSTPLFSTVHTTFRQIESLVLVLRPACLHVIHVKLQAASMLDDSFMSER